ncbi:MAG TPA: isoprenylcysteine carboxylmethyltransferase family protein [Gaiellaceae bacterium]|nr:isoprenylcysteine carboxylmethyltransferase family protein [Gaiellaceae bacterium]
MTGERNQRLLGNAALVVLFASFAYANLMRWHQTGHPVGLGIVCVEGMTALLFIVRRPSQETSRRTLAWLAAPVGAFAMLLARPVGHPDAGPLAVFEVVQLIGLAIAFVGLGFLGRSFGIVAALRRVKTSGVYGLVRHPIYAAYLLSYTGYVLENMSVRNIALLALSTAGQLARIAEEERVLVGDPDYRAYRQRVRYRLIPFIY